MGVFRSITLRMTTAPVHRTWRDLVPLVQHGRLDTSGIFTHVHDLDDAAAAYARVAERSADCVKVRFASVAPRCPAPGCCARRGVSSARPSASSSGGRYMPNRPR